MKNFIQWILSFFNSTPSPVVTTPVVLPKKEIVKPARDSAATGQPAPKDIPPVVTKKYLFDTPQNSRHSIRVICDEEGLSLYDKNVITACIEQESNFMNYKNGNPVKRDNYYNGKIWSTDWGIVQINDTKGWHIGPGLPFSSVDDVLQNPEKAVRYMVRMQKIGKLKLWVSYSSGAYEKYMPQ